MKKKKSDNPPRSEKEIIEELEELTQEPGFIYSLAFALACDLFFDPDEVAEINWRDRLNFQELTLLVGLMVKHPIFTDILPTEEGAKRHLSMIYHLLEELHEAHKLPFLEILEEKFQKQAAPEKEESEEASGSLMREAIFYGESGAYDFQYRELACERYEADNSWIEENKKISIPTMTAIDADLKKLTEKKWHKVAEARDFESACRFALSIFCFTREDLQFSADDVSHFLEAFSLIPGTVNQELDGVGTYNALCSHPIISLGDNLHFLPIGFLLAQSIYESPFYWMLSDPAYRDRAFRNRGEATESMAHRMLEAVFGKENVFRDIKVRGEKRLIVTDIDTLAVAGNKAVVIQAKSKKLTELARKGDEETLRNDFREAVQKAYDQGLACRNAIINKENILIGKDGKQLKLEESIDDAYIVCLTSDHYPAITHQRRRYLKKKMDDPYPLAMSIFDLEIIAFYLREPFEFLYYLRQRINLSEYFWASSEMTLLAVHLKRKLFPDPKYTGEILDDSFAQFIDANYPATRGFAPKTSAMDRLHHKWKNPKFDQLVSEVIASKHPRLTDAIFFLYDIAGDGADKLVETINMTKEKCIADNEMHDFSMLFNNGKSGVSYICLPSVNRAELGNRITSHAMARKYRSKADMWLGIGALSHSFRIVDTGVFSKEPWKEDVELERLSNVFLKKGRAINLDGRKIGRNEPCICGSGKEYKKCCGR